MAKFALTIEYDGSRYCGWQRQSHSPSIQQPLEEALSYVADEPVELVCAGRTDTGVHACEQVAHFETSSERSNRAWLLGANCRLPRDIRILWVNQVEETFHARFSAIARSYRYIIMNSQVPSAIFHDKVCWEHRHLDDKIMHSAAQNLLGEHDFSAFRAAGCQAKSPLRDLQQISVKRKGELVFIDVKANAFLHHMVRNLAGSLMTVGMNDQPESWVLQVLRKKDRRLAAKTAPAGGLYFVRAFYPEEFELQQNALRPEIY